MTQDTNNSIDKKWNGNPKRFNWFLYILFFVIYCVCHNFTNRFCPKGNCSDSLFYVGSCLEEAAGIMIIGMVCFLMMNAKTTYIELEELRNKIKSMEPSARV